MDDLFHEIEYDSQPAEGEFIPNSQSIKIPAPEKNEAKTLFYQMRKIARELKERRRSVYEFSGLYRITNRNYKSVDSEIFYKQGVFMEDFSDDYSGYADFSEKYPSYQLMGFEQLRTYFTWRAKVRIGEVRDTSLSYALIYIYELLNNIGADNPEDGLSKLMSFWKAFSIHAPAIDKHISKWIKEYYDYYDFSSNFEPESSFCDSDDLESWNKISSYDITKSRFYIDGNESLVKDCFKMVVRELKRRINFKDLLFSPVSFEREPFRDALFFNESNKTIQMKRLFITDSGKKFVGYILKKTEVCIRRQVKFKYKIKADLGEFDEDIEQAVRGYFAELNRVEVEVDLGNLERIRKEASGTLEKLVVPEPEDEPEMGETVKVFETREVSESNAENPFGETELKALALLLNDEKSIKQFADENGIMTEVLVDGINEKAFDLIGDSLIDDDFKVYDDYVNQMKEMLQI